MIRRAVVLGVVFALCTQFADAARIYNNLPVEVTVYGGGHRVTLAPGEKSPSLSWPTFGVVAEVYPGDEVCRVGFVLAHEMTGPNYMTIGFEGRHVTCSVCNASYQQIASGTGHIPRHFWSRVDNRSSKRGC